MKKRGYISLILTLILVLLIAGCGTKESPSPSSEPSSSSSTEPEGTKPSSASPSDASSVSVSTSPSEEASSTPAEVSSKPSPSTDIDDGKDYDSLGWQVVNEGFGDIKNRMSASELIDLLGEPESKSETTTWGADGLDHTDWEYTSKGLLINMAQQPDDTEPYIDSITASAPCDLATQRGIKLGDSKEDVLSAYENEIDPKANDDTDSWIVIGSVFGGMGIGIENGVVTYIFIGAAAE